MGVNGAAWDFIHNIVHSEEITGSSGSGFFSFFIHRSEFLSQRRQKRLS
jgi:hypothetical protein